MVYELDKYLHTQYFIFLYSPFMTKFDSNQIPQMNEVPTTMKHPKNTIISLLFISMIVSFLSSYYFSQEISKNVTANFLAIEYDKSGGKENYELITKAQQLQMKQQIPQIREFIKGGGKANPAAPTQAATAPSTADAIKQLSPDELAAIKKDAYIEGNKDALITVIEYDDLECPFCIRQYKEGTIQKIHDKYNDKVNSIFKNFRGVAHENSETEANATLCAGDIGGTDAYVSYYNAIFTRTNGGNGTGFSRDALLPLAKELKIDGNKFQACLDSKKNIARFDSETAEGSKLGVQGTPGNIIINNKTGEYILIAGAYPVSEFERVIDKLLK